MFGIESAPSGYYPDITTAEMNSAERPIACVNDLGQIVQITTVKNLLDESSPDFRMNREIEEYNIKNCSDDPNKQALQEAADAIEAAKEAENQAALQAAMERFVEEAIKHS